jgi:16S rRNA (cytosine967-C5)-methyltransferase
VLDAVLEGHRPLEEALEALPTRLEARDRAAAHRIAATVLRRLGSIDAVLEPLLRREPPPPARHALRIGVAELLLLGTPSHAAVASAVDLAPRAFAGLVNAVLRKVAAEGQALLEGLDAARFATRSGTALADAVKPDAVARLVEQGLLISDSRGLRLTAAGWPRANAGLAEIAR